MLGSLKITQEAKFSNDQNSLGKISKYLDAIFIFCNIISVQETRKGLNIKKKGGLTTES
jgi:hypothetical protein